MQLYIEIILLPVRKKLYLVKIDQELYVSSRYMVSDTMCPMFNDIAWTDWQPTVDLKIEKKRTEEEIISK